MEDVGGEESGQIIRVHLVTRYILTLHIVILSKSSSIPSKNRTVLQNFRGPAYLLTFNIEFLAAKKSTVNNVCLEMSSLTKTTVNSRQSFLLKRKTFRLLQEIY